MAREHRKKRRMQIRQRQKRARKLAKLREKYAKSKTSRAQEEILKKVFKIAPWLSKEQFLEPVEDKIKSKA